MGCGGEIRIQNGNFQADALISLVVPLIIFKTIEVTKCEFDYDQEP